MNYEDSLDWLYNLQYIGIKLGLDNTKALLAELGNPYDKLKIIHVAGTNGKGSVCAFLTSVLVEAGYKVGTYTSPHLKEFGERIAINGYPMTHDEFVRGIVRIKPKVEERANPKRGSGDIREAWSGVDGTQMILRVLLSEGINKGRLSLSRLLRVGSRNPAKIFGLYPMKGVLRIGSDADFVIIDQTREEKIKADMMFSKCGWTLYEGMTMKGVPVMTFSRGVQVYKNGKITGKPGHGKFQAMGSGIRPNGE